MARRWFVLGFLLCAFGFFTAVQGRADGEPYDCWDCEWIEAEDCDEMEEICRDSCQGEKCDSCHDWRSEICRDGDEWTYGSYCYEFCEWVEPK